MVDEKSDKNAWSGGVSGLFRVLQRPAGALDTLNAYVSWKHNFKPAAPNLAEAESAEILEPETVEGEEVGIKTLVVRQHPVAQRHGVPLPLRQHGGGHPGVPAASRS